MFSHEKSSETTEFQCLQPLCNHQLQYSIENRNKTFFETCGKFSKLSGVGGLIKTHKVTDYTTKTTKYVENYIDALD